MDLLGVAMAGQCPADRLTRATRGERLRPPAMVAASLGAEPGTGSDARRTRNSSLNPSWSAPWQELPADRGKRRPDPSSTDRRRPA